MDTPEKAGQSRARVDELLESGHFKVLSDPMRARLLACLIKCGRPCSVTEIADCCPIGFSMVARHLGVLARAGLIRSQKEGRTVWYEASSAELSARFRALAEAIEEWPSAGCCDDGERGSGCDAESRDEQ